jgi:ankyrin repeat protein
VRVLLSKGAEVNIRFKGDWTPRLHAVQTGNVDILELLRAAGARVNDVYQPEEWSILHIAA